MEKTVPRNLNGEHIYREHIYREKNTTTENTYIEKTVPRNLRARGGESTYINSTAQPMSTQRSGGVWRRKDSSLPRMVSLSSSAAALAPAIITL
jgi:hypothetical protein